MKVRVPSILLFLSLLMTVPGFALIAIGPLDKDKAAKQGIIMKARKNGDAGVKVWVEFKEEGILKGFRYAKLLIQDQNGKHRVSARLSVGPTNRDQNSKMVSAAFSAAPDQLKNCTFRLVAYGGGRGGVGYDLKVTDFIDLNGVE